MIRHTCLSVLLGALFILVGCPTEEPADDDTTGDDDTGDDDTGDDDTGDDDAADDDTDPVETVAIEGWVSESDFSTPIEGDQVCWNPPGGGSICDETDADGSYRIEGITSEEYGYLDLSKDGFGHYLYWRDSPKEDDTAGFFHYSTAETTGLYSSAGNTEDPALGSVIVQVLLENWAAAEGALPTLTATDGAAGGDGPYFTAAGSLFEVDLEATATTSSGLALYTNVALGEYAVAVSLDGADCFPMFGGDPSTLEVYADAVSVVIIVCGVPR